MFWTLVEVIVIKTAERFSFYLSNVSWDIFFRRLMMKFPKEYVLWILLIYRFIALFPYYYWREIFQLEYLFYCYWARNLVSLEKNPMKFQPTVIPLQPNFHYFFIWNTNSCYNYKLLALERFKECNIYF